MRSLESKVAQLIRVNLPDLIEVRVGEQLASIPKDKIIVVNLDSKRPKNTAFADVFENNFKIQLRMHYADSTENEMQEASEAIHFSLMNLNAWNAESEVLNFQITETKKLINEDNWIEEFTYTILSVDKES